MSKFVAALALAAVLAVPASAQTLGIPVMNTGVPTGLGLAADVGFGNDAAGNGRAYGASVTAGIGILGVGASVSRFSPDSEYGEAITSLGANASLSLFGGPLIPFRVTLQAGVGRWEYDAFTIEGEAMGTVVETHVPVSIGLAATIPIPGFSIKPWLAPRVEYARRAIEGDNAGTDWNIAMSGGIEARMLSGLTLRAAYDRVFRDGSTPGVFSIGVGFGL